MEIFSFSVHSNLFERLYFVFFQEELTNFLYALANTLGFIALASDFESCKAVTVGYSIKNFSLLSGTYKLTRPVCSKAYVGQTGRIYKEGLTSINTH